MNIIVERAHTYRLFCLFLVVCFQLIFFAVPGDAQTQRSPGSLAEFAGRYADGLDYAVYFEQTKYGLTIRPVLWSATQLLKETAPDKFVVVDRVSRGVDFIREAKTGRVSGARIHGMDGEGLNLVRADGPALAIELFLSGKAHFAVSRYIKRGPAGTAAAFDAAEQVLRRLPTETARVVAFLSALVPQFANDAKFYTLLGFAYVQTGNRRAALINFKRAFKLDPANKNAISGLARLGELPAGASAATAGWKLPFPLSSVFAKVTPGEISAVESDWAARDLSPHGIKQEYKGKITIGTLTGNVSIVSHLVQGSRHYGAIIVPMDARPGCCPVIIEARGVSPTYYPMDLNGIHSPRMMGDTASRFIYVIPSFRGEVMKFDGKTYISEGDRTDALDGATDDAIALLNVALQTTPEGDAERICAFGHSRGGNVALLAGIRDKRITCVVNWAGPTDWFELMGTGGWTEQELWAEGLRTRANTLETGGQNIERFLLRAIDGTADLKGVRRRMLASSPLYFAGRLPLSQHHYGLDDPSVPSRNGYGLVNELRRNKVPVSRYQAFFYPGQGHDTDRIAAPRSSAAFIIRVLKIK